ncbi:unnamed protein product [Mycoplasma amphoriforme A39]|uniref:Uncharacterized protein n=1 Tax=Mycoplasma amphoriforme A39 TaxID=572419 RepID=A0A292IJX6_9MOLU|nr:unnamed protein product [Mycoplasma amphoriforme A39]
MKQDDSKRVGNQNQNSIENGNRKEQQSPGQAQNPNNQNQAGQSPAGKTGNNTPSVQQSERNNSKKENQQSSGQAQNPNNQNQAGQSPAGKTGNNTPSVQQPERNNSKKENQQSAENEKNKMGQDSKEEQKGKQDQSKDNKPTTKQFHYSLDVTTLKTQTISQQQLQENPDFMVSKDNFENFKKIINDSKRVPDKNDRKGNNGNEIEEAEIKGINQYLQTLTFNETLLKDYLITIISNEIQKRSKVSKIELQYSFTDSNNFSFNISIHVSLQLEREFKSFEKKWKSSAQTKYGLVDNGYQFTNVIVDQIDKGDNDAAASQIGNPIYLDREISGMFFGLLKTNESSNKK